jgi:hypothetical protein
MISSLDNQKGCSFGAFYKNFTNQKGDQNKAQQRVGYLLNLPKLEQIWIR